MQRCIARWLPFLAILLGAITLPASEPALVSPAEAFDQANRLYEERRFEAAVAAYRKLLTGGIVTPAVHFNLGNALHQTGHRGRAIAHYREALRLDPRDPDIRANLRFLRQQIGGGVPHPQDESWLHRLTLDEWTLTATGGFWLVFLLLSAARLNPDWGPRLRVWTFAAIGLAAVLLAGLALTAWRELLVQRVIVVVPEAVVRYGPVEGSESYYTVRDGTELIRIGEKDGWLRVVDEQERPGWIVRDSVLELPPGKRRR